MSARHGPAVELVTIGEELLLGTTTDTNSAWLGARLTAAGIRVARRTTVGDEAAAITAAVGEALARTGAVLCTGGLGPTADDLTREAVAALFGVPLELDETVLAAIEERFRRRGRAMPGINRTQAMVPAGARVLPNAWGTAPGLVLEDDRGRFAVLLPGVPSELRRLTEASVLPLLTERLGARPGAIRYRLVRTTGVAESWVAERLQPLLGSFEPMTLAFLPSWRGVDVRITAWGDDAAEAATPALERAAAEISRALAPHVYATDERELVDVVAEALRARRLRLAVAESCTGGMLAARLTDPPGASSFFLGGMIAYADEVKRLRLDVPIEVLRTHGAVSEATARVMAASARAAFDADLAVAITGIAGPSGGSEAKPVGTVWIACATAERVEARVQRFPGERVEVRERSVQAALAWILELVGPAETWRDA